MIHAKGKCRRRPALTPAGATVSVNSHGYGSAMNQARPDRSNRAGADHLPGQPQDDAESLGVHAAQFPLALKAVLFVLEEPQPEFDEQFISNCHRLGLPKEFFEPIARHSDVNEGESHDDISRDLLERVNYVSAEEMIEIEKAVADMVEQLAAAGQEMCDWYGSSPELRLRTW